MRNRYPGTCFRCGEPVAKGKGHFQRTRDGRWLTQHAECAVKYRGTNVGYDGRPARADEKDENDG